VNSYRPESGSEEGTCESVDDLKKASAQRRDVRNVAAGTFIWRNMVRML
jgi:hypothetical protein